MTLRKTQQNINPWSREEEMVIFNNQSLTVNEITLLVNQVSKVKRTVQGVTKKMNRKGFKVRTSTTKEVNI